ncbi:MAG: aromatic amino acid ammonia-lyase [Pseudomonadota bacterium]
MADGMTREARSERQVLSLGEGLSLEDACALASGAALPSLSEAVAGRIKASHQRLRRCIAEGRLVYGVTTGFGPLANRLVSPDEIETLQRHLIYHLATGVGDVADWRIARMIVLTRLSSISRGVSGASPDLVARLLRLLEGPYAPRIPMKGTVGASGDLTPLAHLALALMGQGGFLDCDGNDVASEHVLRGLGGPLTLCNRDALALVNGTSVMTAVAVLNAVQATRLVRMAEVLTVGFAELMDGTTEAWDPAFADVRPHPGQRATTERLGQLCEGSALMRRTRAADTRLGPTAAGTVEERTMQDAYTIRCAPQVIGAVRDMLTVHREIVSRELNSATDNPVFPDGALALHGGNFMGQHVGFASDTLSNAILALAGFAERQIARVTDERLNGGLPAFLHRGPCGLNSGLMGAQVTATAVLAEMRTRAVPASVQSISTNGANQDFVSMGTIAARNARLHLADLSQILAILALAVAQGIDCRGGPGPFAPATRHAHARVRGISAPLERDRPLSDDIQRLAEAILEGALEAGPEAPAV